jgi:hypothetical protein
MTKKRRAVLHALLLDPDTAVNGLEIWERTGLLAGTTYPILSHLRRIGWVRSFFRGETEPDDKDTPASVTTSSPTKAYPRHGRR